MSQEAREVWEPRTTRVSNAWRELEQIAVMTGIKPLALQSCSPEELITLNRWATKHELSVLPLCQEGAAKVYGNASIPYRNDQPWTYRVVVGSYQEVIDFSHLWDGGDNVAIGKALGFPECCRLSFQKYWVEKEWRDMTYPMVMNGEDNHFDVSGPIGCNILLRWIGVRLVSHLPCNFRCGESKRIGDDMLELAKTIFPTESAWLEEMLNWPVRWSSLHGVALITTPVMRIVTASDSLSARVTIDRAGKSYPAVGLSGVEFPFRQTHPLTLVVKDVWTDNGFKTMETMDASHLVLFRVINRMPREITPKVIDLGCGNGLLLTRIGDVLPNVELHGVESDAGRHERAARRLAVMKAKVFNNDIHEGLYWDPPYGLVIISVNRFVEASELDRQILIERISKDAEYLLVYSYDDMGFVIDFNLIDSEDNGQGTKAFLYHVKQNEGTSSGLVEENQSGFGGDGGSQDANDNHRRSEDGGRTERALSSRSEGEAGRKNRHKGRRSQK